MAGIKQLKAWFFTVTSELRLDGTTGGTRLRNTDKPPQQTFENLLASTTFSTESSDRARVSTGATLSSEQGLAVLASDVQARANAAQLSDRSLVVQPHQLPTVEALANSAVEDMPTTALFVQTGGATTRNQFQVRLLGTWVTWLISRLFESGGVSGDVMIKQSGTDYDKAWGNVGNNATTVTNIANNATFVSTLLANSSFLNSIITAITTSSPAAITEALEVGFMRVHPVAAIPSAKWLRCDGSSIATATYPDLFALIGYSYGGAGANFNIPDLRDRQITGYSGTKAIASTGGAGTHTLIEANLPPHAHSLGGATGTTSADGSHSHGAADQFGLGANIFATVNVTGATTITGIDSLAANTDTEPDHTHTVTLDAGNTGNGSGTSTAVNHLDPYLATNIIIKVLP